MKEIPRKDGQLDERCGKEIDKRGGQRQTKEENSPGKTTNGQVLEEEEREKEEDAVVAKAKMTVDTDIAVDNLEDLSDQCCCTICSESFDSTKFIPRTLDCGHTFCHNCLYNDKLRVNNAIKCPMCSRITDLPDGKSLTINYFALSMSDKVIKSRADPKVVCKVCQRKFSPSAVRICIKDGCNMFNQLICLNCAIDDGHGGHVVKYDAKMEKIREDLRLKVKDLCDTMEGKKTSVLEKTNKLARMAKLLEGRLSEVQIPLHIIGQLDTLASEQESNEWLEIVNDLADTLISGCNTLSQVLDSALTSATQQFDDLFDGEEGVEGGGDKADTN